MNSNPLFHTSDGIIAIAYCCKFTLATGEIIGLTDRDSNITIGGIVYNSDPEMNVVMIHNGKNAGSVEIETMAETNTDKPSSSYSLAKIEVFLVNYENVYQRLSVFKGIVHKEVYRSKRLSIYARKELAYELSKKVCGVFSPQCRAQFCDHHCKLNSAQFTLNGSVEKVLDEHKSFEDSKLVPTNDYYKYGVVKFLTGGNKNLSLQVCSHSGNSVILAAPAPYPITTGTSYSIIAGCDKNFSTCGEKFRNTMNFRGEPHIPDIHSIYTTSD